MLQNKKKQQRLCDSTILLARRSVFAALSYAVAHRARLQGLCPMTPFGLFLVQVVYFSISTKKREATCRLLHL